MNPKGSKMQPGGAKRYVLGTNEYEDEHEDEDEHEHEDEDGDEAEAGTVAGLPAGLSDTVE